MLKIFLGKVSSNQNRNVNVEKWQSKKIKLVLGLKKQMVQLDDIKNRYFILNFSIFYNVMSKIFRIITNLYNTTDTPTHQHTHTHTQTRKN